MLLTLAERKIVKYACADCRQQTATILALQIQHKPASVYTLYIYLLRQFFEHSQRCAGLLQDEEEEFGYDTITRLQFP